MSKPMTHLEAFCSPDAINGRVWTDGCSNYKRHYNHLWIDAHKDGAWKFYDEQVAAMSDDVVWAANEPKTLTPQEALRALADGKCVKSSRFIYKLVGEEICDFNDGRVPIWSPVTYVYRDGSIIAPDPSQPAEPQVDDKVKRIPGCECHLEVGDSPCRVHGEDEEAEPQVEYPKSSCSCMGDASCPCRRNK